MMDADDKQAVLDIIDKSDFTPQIWQVSLSANSFRLEFKKLNQSEAIFIT